MCVCVCVCMYVYCIFLNLSTLNKLLHMIGTYLKQINWFSAASRKVSDSNIRIYWVPTFMSLQEKDL